MTYYATPLQETSLTNLQEAVRATAIATHNMTEDLREHQILATTLISV